MTTLWEQPGSALMGLLWVWHLLRCVQLYRWERRGRPVPLPLWWGLPLAIFLLGELLLLDGLFVSHGHHAIALVKTKDQFIAWNLIGAISLAQRGCWLALSGLLWSSVWALLARRLAASARSLVLAMAGLVVLVVLNMLQQLASLLSGEGSMFSSMPAPLLLPAVGLLVPSVGVAVGLRADRPVPWRGFDAHLWAAPVASLAGLVSVLLIVSTELSFTPLAGAHRLEPVLETLPRAPLDSSSVRLDAANVVLPGEEGWGWRWTVSVIPANTLLAELPEYQTISLVVCPRRLPSPHLPPWLDRWLPTRGMACGRWWLERVSTPAEAAHVLPATATVQDLVDVSLDGPSMGSASFAILTAPTNQTPAPKR